MSRPGPEVIAAWFDGTTEYRAVSKNPTASKESFIIEEQYNDSLGKPSWRVVDQGEGLDPILKSILKSVNSGKYELVKKY